MGQAELEGVEPKCPGGLPLAEQRPPLCPEIRLRLLGPEVDVDRALPELCVEPTPYWAFCWGAGQLLARYLLDHPELVRGRCVADFGTGCGVVAIAAARAGASRVRAWDANELARAATRVNASLNGLPVEVAAGWDEGWSPDLLVASDVCYEAENAGWLLGQAVRGREVLLSDPGRRHLPREQLELLCEAEARTFPDVDAPYTRAAVYRVRA